MLQLPNMLTHLKDYELRVKNYELKTLITQYS